MLRTGQTYVRVAETGENEIAGEIGFIIELGVGLRDDGLVFLFSGKVFHVVGHMSTFYLAVWGFDKAEIVDLGMHAEGGNQTDVRSFRRLNRAEATIVGIVNVTYFEAGALTGKTTRSEGRHPTLVR